MSGPQAGRNAFDYEHATRTGSSRDDELTELREAIKTLTAQVGELAGAKK